MLLAKTKNSTPLKLIVPHFIFGSLAFLTFSVLLLFSSESFGSHFFNPKTLALTHVLVLGWACMVIFGALYQLIPVLLITKLYSVKLGFITFVLFGIGIVILAFSFWNFYVGISLQIAAIFIFLAILFFVTNVFLTSKNATQSSISIDCIIASVIWLLITCTIGLLMVFNFTYVFLPNEHLYYLKMHANIGVAGWFFMLIIGVSSKLFPMFLLSNLTNTKKISVAYYLINIGLLAFLADTIFSKSFDRALYYFILIAAGALSYILFVVEAFKKRVRKKVDIGMNQSLMAIVFLFLPLLFGILFFLFSKESHSMYLKFIYVYASCLFLGFISLLIFGQTFKILPFIIWIHRYGDQSAKEKVPLPKDLYSESLLNVQYLAFLVAFLFLIVGVLISNKIIIIGSAFLFIFVSVCYNINIFKLLLNLRVKK